MQLKPNKKSFLIKGLKIKFSLTMILFTFATTPEPQMFDGYRRIKRRIGNMLYEVILQNNKPY